MKEKIKENFKTQKGIVALIIGAGTLLVATFGAAFAYFSVTADNRATNTTVTGALVSKGNVTLTTNTSNLYLNLDGVLMGQTNIGTKYFATTDVSGVPITNGTQGNGIYTLATVSLASGDTQYNCTYNYDITGTLTNPISDGSDEDIKVTIKGNSIADGEKVYTLKDILAGNQTLSGTFRYVTAGIPQTITIESTVENTSDKQDDFAGNDYRITITPRAGSDGFSCDVAESLSDVLATRLIQEGNMWQSGLQGDGHRFAGAYTCSYENGSIDSLSENGQTCSTLYNIVATQKSDGAVFYGSDYSCPPESDALFTYQCTEAPVTLVDTSPDNFICFGTTNKDTCKANEDKYLYRIIGVFEDAEGNNHAKLIKYKQLPSAYAWNADTTVGILWENSDLYSGLNGSYFLNNATYDYMQNESWSNKITNWTWNVVNTQTDSNSGPRYYSITTTDLYLHEMNRTNKTISVGEWTTPTGKIGLMYGSDYMMSLGSSSLTLTGDEYVTLRTGWMHQINNDITVSTDEWTMPNKGANGDKSSVWAVSRSGSLNNEDVDVTLGVRPVFYLESDVTYQNGTGDYADPIILK